MLTCNQAPLKISISKFLLEVDFVSVEYLIAVKKKIFMSVTVLLERLGRSRRTYTVSGMKLATGAEKDRGISITLTNIFKVGDLIYPKFFWVHRLPEPEVLRD